MRVKNGLQLLLLAKEYLLDLHKNYLDKLNYTPGSVIMSDGSLRLIKNMQIYLPALYGHQAG